MDAGRSGSLAPRIENSDLITVIVLPLKYEFISLIAMSYLLSFPRAGGGLSHIAILMFQRDVFVGVVGEQQGCSDG